MNLALNNLQMLICHKTNQPTSNQQFPDNDPVIAVMKMWATSTNVDFYILTNCGDYMEDSFVAENLLYPTAFSVPCICCSFRKNKPAP